MAATRHLHIFTGSSCGGLGAFATTRKLRDPLLIKSMPSSTLHENTTQIVEVNRVTNFVMGFFYITLSFCYSVCPLSIFINLWPLALIDNIKLQVTGLVKGLYMLKGSACKGVKFASKSWNRVQKGAGLWLKWGGSGLMQRKSKYEVQIRKRTKNVILRIFMHFFFCFYLHHVPPEM